MIAFSSGQIGQVVGTLLAVAVMVGLIVSLARRALGVDAAGD